MEASKVSFFKKTKDEFQKTLTAREKGKLRLDRIYKTCPDSGVTLQEMMKIAGYDPGIPKQYQAGAAFINYHRKKGNIIEIPNLSSNKKEVYLLGPNTKKVKTTPIKKEAAKIDFVKQIQKKFDSIDIRIVVDKNEYSFELENIERYKAKDQIIKLMEMVWHKLMTFNL